MSAAALRLFILRAGRGVKEGEELLRDSEARRLALEEELQFTCFSIDQTVDAIYWVTTDYRFCRVNAAACEMLGYTQGELLSLTVRDIDTEWTFPEWRENVAAVKGNDGITIKTSHRTKAGSVIPVEIKGKHFSYRGEDFICAIVRDITERIASEKTASFFSTLIEFTQDPVYVLDPHSTHGRMVYANEAACRHFGLPREQLLTMSIPDWDPEFDVSDLGSFYQLLKEKKSLSFETVHRVASGAMVPVQVNANHLKRGTEEYVAGYFQSIKGRKAMEEALRESERNLIEAQRIARVGNWVCDRGGRLLSASEECFRIYGMAVDKGDDLRRLRGAVHPEDLEVLQSAFRELVGNRRSYSVEFRIVHRDGAERILREHGEVTGSGKEVRLAGIVQDVTEQRQSELEQLALERQLLHTQKLESLGVLAGGIAHDFNNVLAAVLGNLSLVRLTLPEEHQAQERLSRCEKAVEQATGLTRQLLTFSRGGDPVKKLLALGGGVTSAVSFALHGSNVASVVEIAPELWPVEADEGQMGQVLNNLLINACQAMPEGGKVTVRLENCTVMEEEISSLAAGSYVSLSVSDQGKGIPPKHLDKIFDPYFTTKETGSGLGLSSVYSIVKKHQGQVLVSSRVGGGSTFTVYLPAAPEQHFPREMPADAAFSAGEGTVFVMDDEETVREVVQEMLGLMGYTVVPSSGGEEVVEGYRAALKENAPPDAVIMDLTVPGKMGGLQAAAEILKLHPKATLIVSSGYSNDPVLANFESFGFIDALLKPFRFEELSAVLSRLTKKPPAR